MRARRISFAVSPRVAKSLREIAAQGRKVQVLGQVKKGKLEIDYAGLAEFSKKLRKQKVWFVALNAPFKTRALTGSL